MLAQPTYFDPRGILVIGPVDTPADIKRLRAYAWLVATETGRQTTYATSRDVDASAFAELFIMPGLLDRSRSIVDIAPWLVFTTAVEAGVRLVERQAPEENAVCVCGASQTIRTVWRGDEVWCPVCTGEAAHCANCGDDPFDVNMLLITEGQTFTPMCPDCVEGGRLCGVRIRTVLRQPAAPALPTSRALAHAA